ncbi:TPA: site-specific integrase [Pseudomonas aeruginosa]|nr:site-specific integrase [Pseudomonas aeruginosa]HBN8538007.1 site-specific integrase [Pseudomonas aeruginosa]
MRIVESDQDFKINGVSYPGFPLLIDNGGGVLEIPLLFLIDTLIRSGTANDRKTWKKYGAILYDFLGFLEAKKLSWDYVPAEGSGEVPPLSHYQSWCLKYCKNTRGYVNHKRNFVERLYEWALKNKLISALPFSPSCGSSAPAARLAYGHATAGKSGKSKRNLAAYSKPMKYLVHHQIDRMLKGMVNPTHRSVAYLAVATGLRAEELASFPVAYIQSCEDLPDGISTIEVPLSPVDMDLKYDKPRVISITVGCMRAMWQYKVTERARLVKKNGTSPKELFVTKNGLPFVSDGFGKPFQRLGEKLGFHIHPHMLRHTFALNMLVALRRKKAQGKLTGEPILVLMKLLGHSSVQTTLIYVDALAQMDDEGSTSYQDEIDIVAAGLI